VEQINTGKFYWNLFWADKSSTSLKLTWQLLKHLKKNTNVYK